MTQVRSTRMLNQRQQSYLEAMDIELWRLRQSPLPAAAPVAAAPAAAAPAAPTPTPTPTTSAAPAIQALEPEIQGGPGLKLGPGSGGVLLVCAADVDSSSRLANDIGRALGCVPKWAWPHTDTSAVKLLDAVEDNLFTTVAIFGDDLVQQFFDGKPPVSLNSANLVLLPSMQDLQSKAETRQQLWNTFCRSAMVSPAPG
jgi:DNA polymerase III psi subunit